MRQAFLLIPLPELLTRTKNKTEALEVYKQYYSHLFRQGTEEWKRARAGEIQLPLVAGERELRYIAHRDRVVGSNALLDLYDFTLLQIDELIQTGQVKGSIAFGGSEITKIMKSQRNGDATSVVRDKLLDEFKGNIHTRWGNTFEDVINEFMDMILECSTASFGSIPGIRNSDGATIQNYSPDGLAIVRVNQLMKVLCMYMGTSHVAQYPGLEEFREWVSKQMTRDEDPDSCDAAMLYEFKCPTVRVPNGIIPDNYTLQPQLGATTIGITDVCLFTDTSFRKCAIEDFGLTNTNYDHNFHNGHSEDQLDQPHIACGFLGIYRIGEPDATGMSDILTQAFESTLNGISDTDESVGSESPPRPSRANFFSNIVPRICSLMRRDLLHAGESMLNTYLRRRAVHLVGMAYRYLGIVTAPSTEVLAPEKTLDVMDHLNNAQRLIELRERQRRIAAYNPLHSFNSSGMDEPSLTEEEEKLLRDSRTVHEYIREHFTKEYREILQELIVEICMRFIGESEDSRPKTPAGIAAWNRNQERVRDILKGHVCATLELLDSHQQTPAYMDLTDYGKSSAYEIGKLFTTLEQYRHQPEGVKVYYPRGYYCVRDVEDPRIDLVDARPENYINFGIANEHKRAQDWLKRETDRFLDFCKSHGYVAIGLIPYKMMKVSMIPLIPKSIAELIRPVLEERARVCNEYRGLGKDEILRRLNDLPVRTNGRHAYVRMKRESEVTIVSETSDLDAFL
jgi:hypothetical protein